MKQKNFLRVSFILFLVATTGLFVNCSKDDGPAEEEGGEIITPTEVNQSQVVTIEMPAAVSAAEYTGVFNGNTINLARVGEKNIMFQVPSSVLGEANLIVEGLGLNLTYTVKETVLSGTPEQELEPFFSDITAFALTIQEEETEEALLVNNVITSFNDYYDSLNEEEKQHLAIYYKANHELFNNIISGELNVAGRFNTKDLTFDIDTQLLKHQLAALALGGGAVVVWLAPDPLEKAAGALVAYIAWKKCKNYLKEMMTSKLRKVNVAFGDMLSELNKGPQSSLSFTNGESQSLAFNIEQRDIQSGDTASENEGLHTFFASHGIFTEAVDKVNGVIEFVNDNLFFSNIDLIPVYTMPSEQQTEITGGGEAVFNALQFSVENDNITLNTSYDDGNIVIAFTVNNPAIVEGNFIETNLNYTFQDELNAISGSFPVIVSLLQPSIFTDAAAVKSILEANGIDVSDSRWISENENDVISILTENDAVINNGRVTGLSFQNKGLTTIPASIAGLTELGGFFLGYNSITSLPAEIGSLPNLKVLSIFENNLISIPSEIGNLSNLIKLELDNNNISSLPESLWGLTNLNWLTVGGNNLPVMPAGIGNLVNLTDLGWSTNGLAVLPPEIGNLSNLNALSIFGNELTSLPAEIGYLTNLIAFSVADNALTSLPPEIGNMTSLIGDYGGELDFSDNQLTTIPAEVANLSNVTAIRLSHNMLVSIPAEIGSMNLNTLIVSSNQSLLCLPSAVWNSSTIQNIYFDYTGMNNSGDTNCSE
ncbi:leucine-rich repeat domain-containing protein [Flavobacterium sp.]|uniref:leucine-rich repeat domain-containing protein n=1 Tax=Flavobacterium sp. TaxID=239 RepID=UPI003A8ECE36